MGNDILGRIAGALGIDADDNVIEGVISSAITLLSGIPANMNPIRDWIEDQALPEVVTVINSHSDDNHESIIDSFQDNIITPILDSLEEYVITPIENWIDGTAMPIIQTKLEDIKDVIVEEILEPAQEVVGNLVNKMIKSVFDIWIGD